MHAKEQASIVKAASAFALSAALVIGLGTFTVPAGAAGAQGSITIASQDGSSHTYEAYRLIGGDVAQGKLTHASLAGCIDTSVEQSAGASSENVATAQDTAEWLAAGAEKDADGKFTAKLSREVVKAGASPAATFATGEEKLLDEGYWMIISDDAQPMMLLVDDAAPVSAVEKSTTPSVAKQVQEDATQAWGKRADYSVGDVIQYRLEGTLPLNLAAFETYSYWFIDEMDGVTADPASVHASIVHADDSTDEVALTATFEGGVLKVGSDDILDAVPGLVPSDKVVVEYEATLAPGAFKVGLSEANVNTVHIEYTRSPSKDGTGSTIEDAAGVYTYQIALVKLEQGSAKALEGAKFTMQDNATKKYYTAEGAFADAPATLVTDSKGTLSFAGLDEGSYTIVETEAPAGYDKVAKPIVVTIESDAATAAEPTLSASAVNVKGEPKVDAAIGAVEVTVENPKTEAAAASASPETANPVSRLAHAVKTGDPTAIAGMAVVLVAAIALLVAVARRRRKME